MLFTLRCQLSVFCVVVATESGCGSGNFSILSFCVPKYFLKILRSVFKGNPGKSSFKIDLENLSYVDVIFYAEAPARRNENLHQLFLSDIGKCFSERLWNRVCRLILAFPQVLSQLHSESSLLRKSFLS